MTGCLWVQKKNQIATNHEVKLGFSYQWYFSPDKYFSLITFE